MAFNTEKKVESFLLKSISAFKAPKLKDVIPHYFNMFTEKSLEKALKDRQLPYRSKEIAQLVLHEVKEEEWTKEEILEAAFELELENLCANHRKFLWQSHRLLGQSAHDEISDLNTNIRQTIRNRGSDALVFVNEVDDIIWISVIFKNLKKIGIFEKPQHIALSGTGRYFFTKNSNTQLAEDLTAALGYEKFKKIKFTGRCVKSLNRLLISKAANADVNTQDRPVFPSTMDPVKNQFGFDITGKDQFNEYFRECMGQNEEDDDKIDIQHFTVTDLHSKWTGSDTPELRNQRFRLAVTFSGDVAKIIKQLPIAGIITPPNIPSYLRDFSILATDKVHLG